MSYTRINKKERRSLRRARIRSRVRGTATRPRLAIFRSSQHMYAQLIDDAKGVTVVSVSTQGMKKAPKQEQSMMLGEKIAEAAATHKITEVVFDRGGYQYHGRVKAVAEGARKKGLTL